MTYRPPRRVARFRGKDRARLEARMRAANLSGAELAARIGVTRQFVSAIRRGRIAGMQVENAARLEEVLDVQHGYLFAYPAEDETAAAS